MTASRAQFHQDLAQTLNDVLGVRNERAPLVLVDAPGGIGKSHVTAQLLSGRRIVWMAQRNEQLDDLRGFLSTPLDGHTLPTHPIPTVEKRPARRDPGFCSQYNQRVKPRVDCGYGPFLRFTCALCPDRPGCRYRRWRPRADWIFSPHARLSLPNHPDIFEGRDAVVIDESPVGELLRALVADRDQIKRWIWLLRSERMPNPAEKALLALLTALHELLMQPPAGASEIDVRKVAESLGYYFATPAVPPSALKGKIVQLTDYFVVRLLGRGAPQKDVISLFDLLLMLRADYRVLPVSMHEAPAGLGVGS